MRTLYIDLLRKVSYTSSKDTECFLTICLRRAKREPDCLALCYISFKQAVDEQVARAEKQTEAKEAFVPYWKKAPAPVDPKTAVSDAKYQWSALDGKYM